ncbi:MAG TPA: hypothetical protein VMM78_04965, partial [Thermomicrobiales bacterium]|nr:hypothetical protein [Thermomicrobiales bacterium]
MKHDVGDDRECRSSRQQSNDPSTVISVRTEELERRKAFIAEIDRIRRRIGPVEMSAVEMLDVNFYDIDSNDYTFTPDELERRKALADEADRIRAAFGPLGFSAVEVI